MIPKGGGKPHHLPGSWRPLALLPCVGKILERVVTDRLQELVIHSNLLPKTQYGMTGKSTTTALQFLLNPVYAAWSTAPKKYISILSIDIKGAYDRVDREKLLEILIGFGIPEWLVEFVASFLSNRSTVAKLPGSPLSPILCLFYTAPLLRMVSEQARGSEAPSWLKSVQFYCFAFVDDTDIMLVFSSYRTNCRALEFAHEEILKWARPMGVTFSTGKSHLMHFKPPWSRDPDCRLTVNIEGFDTKNEPVDELKILGVIVDRRLRWTAHIDQIEAKVELQLAILTRFSGSVWGTPLMDLITLYATKIRSTITYACPAWFIYDDYDSLDLCLDEIQLKKLQYKCLLKISGALRGTCARVLEKELVTDDIEVTPTRHVMTHQAKILDTPEYEFLATVRSDLTQSGTSTRGNQQPFEVLENQTRLLRDITRNDMIQKVGPFKDGGREPHGSIRPNSLDYFSTCDCFWLPEMVDIVQSTSNTPYRITG
ncbi:hypothetical protein FPHYL_13652 [Fusarium phyllophilum]|uniref:Reverse transcriptase domain-containing protein n=1 Tax=Fusarium phyllophilum TaxID=47803 RepID=A0A8H5IC95_9HYPO|nr:hypothetical protein FPHYL_13652 [Fusarium phyllophilum]